MCLCVKRLLLVWFHLTITYSITSYGNVVFDLCPLFQKNNHGVKHWLLVTLSNKMSRDSVMYWLPSCGLKSYGLLNMVSSLWTFWTDTQYSMLFIPCILIEMNVRFMTANVPLIHTNTVLCCRYISAAFTPSLESFSPFWSWFVKSTWFTLAAKLL